MRFFISSAALLSISLLFASCSQQPNVKAVKQDPWSDMSEIGQPIKGMVITPNCFDLCMGAADVPGCVFACDYAATGGGGTAGGSSGGGGASGGAGGGSGGGSTTTVDLGCDPYLFGGTLIDRITDPSKGTIEGYEFRNAAGEVTATRINVLGTKTYPGYIEIEVLIPSYQVCAIHF